MNKVVVIIVQLLIQRCMYSKTNDEHFFDCLFVVSLDLIWNDEKGTKYQTVYENRKE